MRTSSKPGASCSTWPAILDRIDRGGGLPADPRVANIRKAVQTLLGGADGRAEAVQTIFSLPYDPAWTRPLPGEPAA